MCCLNRTSPQCGSEMLALEPPCWVLSLYNSFDETGFCVVQENNWLTVEDCMPYINLVCCDVDIIFPRLEVCLLVRLLWWERRSTDVAYLKFLILLTTRFIIIIIPASRLNSDVGLLIYHKLSHIILNFFWKETHCNIPKQSRRRNSKCVILYTYKQRGRFARFLFTVTFCPFSNDTRFTWHIPGLIAVTLRLLKAMIGSYR
jgi:hypothetical protein